MRVVFFFSGIGNEGWTGNETEAGKRNDDRRKSKKERKTKARFYRVRHPEKTTAAAPYNCDATLTQLWRICNIS